MSKTLILLFGLIIGLLYPLAIDMMLYGTITPCATYETFEDGSRLMRCEDRR